MAPRASTKPITVASFCQAMEAIAPCALAQGWDNVGLLAGDREQAITRALLCIDLTHAVVDEAVRENANVVMAYHPPLFKPITRLQVPSDGTDGLVFRCIAQGIAIYSTHTALDAADGGTNDVLAELCGLQDLRPIEYVDRPGSQRFKLVAFVPPDQADQVARAMFDAGAGHIGDYHSCSFRGQGEGTFVGAASTQPSVGQRGRFERVEEVRLETIVPIGDLAAVVRALIDSQSYEEPAFDIYPLQAPPSPGIGRVGRLIPSTSLEELSRRLAGETGARSVQLVGRRDAQINRAIIVAGAAGDLPFRLQPGPGDVIVTGEIRHHDALSIDRRRCSAIALGHWASERPAIKSLASRLMARLPGVDVVLSQEDRDPFSPA